MRVCVRVCVKVRERERKEKVTKQTHNYFCYYFIVYCCCFFCFFLVYLGLRNRLHVKAILLLVELQSEWVAIEQQHLAAKDLYEVRSFDEKKWQFRKRRVVETSF